MLTAVGVVGAVVMATGYVMLGTGTVHVDVERQAEPGVETVRAPLVKVRLPLTASVPELFNVWGPAEVNVVAEAVMCQPGPVPVESLTRNDWSAGVGSTRRWSRPFAVSVQPRASGETRDRFPAVMVSVPVIVQAVGVTTGVEVHVAASAVPALVKADAPIPAAIRAHALRTGVTRLFVTRTRCLIAAHLP